MDTRMQTVSAEVSDSGQIEASPMPDLDQHSWSIRLVNDGPFENLNGQETLNMA